jgi:general secretion pathway protein E/type IV pilus assembly protein PilB
MMEIKIDPNSKGLVSTEMAWSYRIIPHHISDAEFQFYTDAHSCSDAKRNDLEIFFGKKIKLIPSEGEIISKYLSKYFLREKTEKTNNAVRYLETSKKDFVSELFKEAKSLNSSDIHIETYQMNCRIRLRIDGKLIERLRVNKSEYPSLINKIKILSGLDISEKRLPQDGRIFLNDDGQKLDVRVSVLPTLHGEKIVLRLLGSNAKDVDLNNLGFSSLDLQRYRESTRKPSGIILISGPTGSGKTTTLYGTMRLLNKADNNIVTIEDPIEYTLEGINQVQAKEEIGLTFSSALRSFLRQDPDVIMVGEIRDAETASLAIRAALTGHLVLSTIHTNSAWGTISRLIDMGVPSFLLANTLNVTVAQRLLRKLCDACKEESTLTSVQFPSNLNREHLPSAHYIAKGCELCFYTGYKGRRAIYEVIPVDRTVADFILHNATDVDAYFKTRQIMTLKASALDLVSRGETSFEEIYPLLLNDQY